MLVLQVSLQVVLWQNHINFKTCVFLFTHIFLFLLLNFAFFPQVIQSVTMISEIFITINIIAAYINSIVLKNLLPKLIEIYIMT